MTWPEAFLWVNTLWAVVILFWVLFRVKKRED